MCSAYSHGFTLLLPSSFCRAGYVLRSNYIPLASVRILIFVSRKNFRASARQGLFYDIKQGCRKIRIPAENHPKGFRRMYFATAPSITKVPQRIRSCSKRTLLQDIQAVKNMPSYPCSDKPAASSSSCPHRRGNLAPPLPLPDRSPFGKLK